MPRYASELKFTSSDGETEVDFTGCRGYLVDVTQFLDDERETKIVAADGTPHFQSVEMGENPHRGNVYGISLENVLASKVIDLILLNKAMRAAGSHMKSYLTDTMVTIDGQNCKADPDASPFWVTHGRESEGMIQDVVIRLVAI